ncbi:MAG: ATP-binding protein [Gammaproteobacteria bacterium]
MTIHSVLLRQLRRCHLSEIEHPQTLSQWQQFLDRINHSYDEIDQDRYLTERSQEISAHEMQTLYTALEEAQSIAHIGSWFYNVATGEMQLSKEAQKILGRDPLSPLTSYQQILEIIHPNDKQYFQQLMQELLNNNKDYEAEIRILINKKIYWLNVLGKKLHNKKNNKMEKLSGTIMDITNRKLTELRLALEHAVVHLLIESDSFSEVMPKIIQQICQTYDWQLGVYWSWDAKRLVLVRKEIWGNSPQTVKKYKENIKNDTCGLDSSLLITQGLSESKQIAIDKIKHISYQNLAKELDIHSVLIFPVESKRELLFVLEFFSSGNEELDKIAQQNINSISYQMLQFYERKRAQEREVQLSKQLTTIKRAGMAETATSVLHNVGNVLNSVNVSAALLSEKLLNTKMSNLKNIADLYQQHSANLGEFITQDQKGQRIPAYLLRLAQYWDQEKDELLKELKSLRKNIQHIKDIITIQQSISSSAGIIAPYPLTNILEEALTIHADGLERNKIRIIRDYQFKEAIPIDKVKLHQILVNLIKNAKDAVLEKNIPDKKITLSLNNTEDSVQIRISDNGIGILQENLTKIFSYGFSTKKNGHGFGLHSSAISAKEMNGSLIAESEGLGKGSTFTLQIPKQMPEEKKASN